MNDPIFKQAVYHCANDACLRCSYANTYMQDYGQYLCPFCRQETYVDIDTIAWLCI